MAFKPNYEKSEGTFWKALNKYGRFLKLKIVKLFFLNFN